MCRAATCRRCGKATWAGCGQHVDSVMKGVPTSDRCTCAREQGVSRRWGLFRRRADR